MAKDIKVTKMISITMVGGGTRIYNGMTFHTIENNCFCAYCWNEKEEKIEYIIPLNLIEEIKIITTQERKDKING